MKIEALRELEPDLWRAPSAHNTQPWVLRYPERDGDPVEVGWDPARALPVADPTGRDLRLGLGAFVECCLVVCATAGLRVAFEPAWDESEPRAGWLVAAPEIYPTPYTVGEVRSRRTARVPYAPEPLPAPLLTELRSIAEADGATLEVLAGTPVPGLLREADVHQYGTPPVMAELRSWLRLSPRHPRYEEDGLTDRALALSRAEALGLRTVLSPRVYPLLRPLGLARLLAASGGAPAGGDILVLVGPADATPEDQLRLGRTLFRVWLTLTREGLATHPLSQLIDAPATRATLAGDLGVADPARLLHIARAGRPLSTPPSSARRVS